MTVPQQGAGEGRVFARCRPAILGVLGLAAYDLALGALRCSAHPEALSPRPDLLGPHDAAAILGSFAKFHAGLLALACGLACTIRSTRAAAGAIVGLLSLSALLESLSHGYFMMTGDLLDWPLLVFAARRPRELALTVRTLHADLWLLAPASFLVGLVVLLLRRPPPAAPLALRRDVRLGGVALCVAGLGLALAADARSWRQGSAQDPVVFLASSFIRGRAAEAQAVGLSSFERVLRPDGDRKGRPAHVVVIFLESVRWRSTSLNPAGPDTTPFLARLARRGLTATRAYVPASRTPKALTATLCGFEPTHQWETFAPVLGMLYDCLPALLSAQGYETAFFQTAPPALDQRNRMVSEFGFREFLTPAASAWKGAWPNALGPPDLAMLPSVEAWLAVHRTSTFAAFLTMNAHFVCNPAAWAPLRPFDDEPEVNCYKNAIRADDEFVRSIYELYRKDGRLNDTLFVILGDHGEAFGEHGLRFHGNVPYDEALRIPLVLHDPGGRRIPLRLVQTPVSQLDVFPTLLELLHFELVTGKTAGVSLLSPQPDRGLGAICPSLDRCLSWMHGRWKYIDYFGRRPAELYDLEQDPGELYDLAARQPDEVRRLRLEAMKWREEVDRPYLAARNLRNAR